ncbi:hypothetical protein Catovirus_1_612 [Catovirus CTV1]|uniref:Bacteriophage T5 Orf172 DNA-binding domain-containing protein n=1 Tax=Catovirus CTV1 TaxID=1977631 RepID=A0A1V0SA32_9VIRU|nr:hypothetical protein Catovirus_1_612 [Catovirus CTV1]
MHYIYVIQPRSSIEGNLSVYKVGITSRDIKDRLSEYEKGSVLKMTIEVTDREVESELMLHLSKKFINRKDYGREYFEGPIKQILQEVFSFCVDYSYADAKNTIDAEIKDPNIKELETLCNSGDLGYVNIFVKNMKDNLVCVDKDKCIFYFFDDSKKLWIKYAINDVKFCYMNNIQKYIKPLCDCYNDMEKVLENNRKK